MKACDFKSSFRISESEITLKYLWNPAPSTQIGSQMILISASTLKIWILKITGMHCKCGLGKKKKKYVI